MAKYGIGPMILATAILAAPVLAVGQSTTPGATPPSTNMNAGVPGSRPASMAPATAPRDSASTSSASSSTSSKPLYTTADNQVRMGKVVGASVYNEQNQSVGSIDDVLMSHDNKATMAVISVGGFLGMGSKLVSVPWDQLKIDRDRIIMPGATKDALKGMPEYKYS